MSKSKTLDYMYKLTIFVFEIIIIIIKYKIHKLYKREKGKKKG